MGPLEIIRKYYAPFPEAFEILMRHSGMVARKAIEVAARAPHLRPDMGFIEEAALLHDIGMFLTDAPPLGCSGDRPYICHGLLGGELLDAEGLPRHAAVCERHVGVGLRAEDVRAGGLPLPERDMTPRSVEEKIICFADKFFSKVGETEKEKTLDSARASVGRYGADKLRVFDEWVELFGE